jgi:hypothetical protein
VARSGTAHVVRAPGVALVVTGGAVPVVEPGWVSPGYGVKVPAPVISVVAEGAADATFTTLVVPLAEAADVPRLDVAREAGATTARVEHDLGTDTVTWGDGARPLDLGPVRCRAAAGWMRRDAGGVVRVRAAGVGHGPVWAGWDRGRGLLAGREGEL